jgi:hypothetical protein
MPIILALKRLSRRTKSSRLQNEKDCLKKIKKERERKKRGREGGRGKKRERKLKKTPTTNNCT